VSEPTPAAAINRLNEGFCNSGWEDRFVTLVLGVLDPTQHTVTIVNAGHMPPIQRCKDGRLEPVAGDQAGMPLGIDPSSRYEQFTLTLEPGCALVMFTDGISEAMTPAANCMASSGCTPKSAGPGARSARWGAASWMT